jgi:hypothetical protein
MNRKSFKIAFGWGGPKTTLRGFGSVLGGPLDTFFWALTILWSPLLAHVGSGPYVATRVVISLTNTLGEYCIHKACKEVGPVPPNLPTLLHVSKLRTSNNNTVDGEILQSW